MSAGGGGLEYSEIRFDRSRRVEDEERDGGGRGGEEGYGEGRVGRGVITTL